jgi:hypothetical protein
MRLIKRLIVSHITPSRAVYFPVFYIMKSNLQQGARSRRKSHQTAVISTAGEILYTDLPDLSCCRDDDLFIGMPVTASSGYFNNKCCFLYMTA